MNHTIILDSHYKKQQASSIIARVDEFAKKKVAVHFTTEKKARTLNQNARYWAVLSAALDWIAEKQGKRVERSAFHEWLTFEILGGTPLEINGKMHHVRPRTRKMSTNEFAEYCLKAETYLIDVLGIPIEVLEYDVNAA